MTEVDMIDAIGSDAGVIPHGTRKVAVYVTGSGGIQWSAAQIAQLRKDGVHTIVRIDQSAQAHTFPFYVVKDIEPGASSILTACAEARARKARGQRTGFYFDEADLVAVENGIIRYDLQGWVDLWVADWNLDHQTASSRLGRTYAGCRVVAVQWASPTSNPGALMPGSHLTLAQANVDLSVTENDWPNQAPAKPKHTVPARAKPHRKVTAAGAGGALGVIISALVAHLTPAEASAISTVAAFVLSWITPSKKHA